MNIYALKNVPFEVATTLATCIAYKSVTDAAKAVSSVMTKTLAYVAEKGCLNCACNKALGYLPAERVAYIKNGFQVATRGTFADTSAGLSDATVAALKSLAITAATTYVAYKFAHNSYVVNRAASYLNQGFNFAISKI